MTVSPGSAAAAITPTWSASACGDDGFDQQLGFTGSLQYAVVLQNGQQTAPAGRDARGIELDNSEFDPAAVPRSDPAFCNVTLIGSKAQQEFPDNGGSDTGIMLRRGTRGQMANLIVTGFQDAGVELREASTTQQACNDLDADGVPESLTGDLLIRNSVFFDNGAGGSEQAKDMTVPSMPRRALTWIRARRRAAPATPRPGTLRWGRTSASSIPTAKSASIPAFRTSTLSWTTRRATPAACRIHAVPPRAPAAAVPFRTFATGQLPAGCPPRFPVPA